MEKELNFNSDEVQKIIKRHYIFIEEFYDEAFSTKNGHTLLANTIRNNPAIRNKFALFHPQLATFMAEAMKAFADRQLK